MTHFGWWRGAIVVAAAAASAALAAWGWHRRAEPLTLPAAAVGVGAIAGALCASRRRQPVRLRWDGEHWSADAPAVSKGDASGPTFHMVVAIDLGPWMLLKLRPAPSHPAARTTWIPVQRRGHEAQWHGMRRAVYFPRPSVGGPPMAELHPPE